jgi:hypothetical protein
MTSPYKNYMTQAEADAAILNNPAPLPGRTTSNPIIALSADNVGGREVEAFALKAKADAATNIPQRPEPTSEEEFNARGWQLRADAAKLGYEVKLMRPEDATPGCPLGLFYPNYSVPFSMGTLSALEHIIAIELVQQVGVDAQRQRAQERTDEVNRAIAETSRRQKFDNDAPQIISELRTEIDSLRAEIAGLRNSATRDVPADAEPVIVPADDDAESYSLVARAKATQAAFLNSLRGV